MTIDDRFWTVRLAVLAENDFRNIIDWTREQFGEKQALLYAETLTEALESLSDGPTIVGVKERREIGKDLFTLHVARGGRRGRHLVLFRVIGRGRPQTIEVLRVLHDAMDLNQHIPR